MPPPRKKEKKADGVTERPPDGVILFEVDEVSTLCTDYSPVIEVKGLPWVLCVYKGSTLAACLYCREDRKTPWRIDIDAEFTLVHPDNRKSVTVKDLQYKTRHSTDHCGVIFDDWKSLLAAEKGFITNNKMTVETRFWITNMSGIRLAPRIDFTDPDEPRHDVALMIGGQKIYASKQILAAHSSVFNTMFYGEFADKNRKEFELKDVDREEFLEMLRVIYPSCKKITEDSANFLLKLGDQFQITYVIDCVEKFLIEERRYCITENFQIADKFRLFGLQELCLSQLKSKRDFAAIKESSWYSELSSETKDRLFERLLEIHK